MSQGCWGDSICQVSNTWFPLWWWSQSRGMEPCFGIHTGCGACWKFSLSPSPSAPSHHPQLSWKGRKEGKMDGRNEGRESGRKGERERWWCVVNLSLSHTSSTHYSKWRRMSRGSYFCCLKNFSQVLAHHRLLV